MGYSKIVTWMSEYGAYLEKDAQLREERASQKSVVIPDGIKIIKSDAYKWYSSVTSITIPDSVISIEPNAFKGCSSLTEIVIPNKVTEIEANAFSGCSSLTRVVLPESLEYIGQDAFSGCSSLTEIVIPDNVWSISYGAFSDCTSLKRVRLPEDLETIDDSLFLNCSALTDIVLPKSLKKIEPAAFRGCSSLAALSLPDTLEDIQNHAFAGCTALTWLTIPHKVRSIGYGAFEDCSSLAEFRCLGQPNLIGKGAFAGCQSLPHTEYDHALYIGYGQNPYHVLAAGKDSEDGKPVTCQTHPDCTIFVESAFSGCRTVEQVVFPKNIKSIPAVLCGCESLKSLVLPDHVTEIGFKAFCGCVALEKITIPDSVTTCGSNAFSGCCALAEVKLPQNLKIIPEEFFKRCSALTSIAIPDAVTEVRSGAFRDCSSLRKIEFSNVKRIGSHAFEGCSALCEAQLPQSLEYVLEEAFLNCTALEEITLPGKKIMLYQKAFCGCTSLQKVSLSDPEAVYDSAFANCTALEEVTFGTAVRTFGKSVFEGCTRLCRVNGAKAFAKEGTPWWKEHFSCGDALAAVALESLDDDAQLLKFYLKSRVLCMQALLAVDREDLIATQLKRSKKIVSTELEEMIRIAGEQNRTTALALLETYKSENYTSASFASDKLKQARLAEQKTTATRCPKRFKSESVCTEGQAKRIFQYEVHDGAVWICKYCGQYREVEIPDVIGTCPVTKICQKAFYGADITKLVISDNVKEIGTEAFDCANLRDVTIPKSYAKQTEYDWWIKRFSYSAMVILLLQNFDIRESVVDHVVNNPKFDLFNAYYSLTEQKREDLICPLFDATKLFDYFGWQVLMENAEDNRNHRAIAELKRFQQTHEFQGEDMIAVPLKQAEKTARTESPKTDSAAKQAPPAAAQPDKAKLEGKVSATEEKQKPEAQPAQKATATETAEERRRREVDELVELEWIRNSFRFEISGNDAARIRKYTGRLREVKIPDRIQRFTVTRISKDAFKGKDITKVVIPDHVTAIGEGAFSTCENLTDVTIPGHFAKQEDYQWWSARFSEPTLTILALQNFKPDAPVVDHIVNRSKTSCDVAFLFLLEKKREDLIGSLLAAARNLNMTDWECMMDDAKKFRSDRAIAELEEYRRTHKLKN